MTETTETEPTLSDYGSSTLTEGTAYQCAIHFVRLSKAAFDVSLTVDPDDQLVRQLDQLANRYYYRTWELSDHNPQPVIEDARAYLAS